MIRPKRTVTETCHRCDRPGWVHSDPYTLLTEDEYLKVIGRPINRAEIKGLPDNYEAASPGSGGSIHDAIKEGIEYCSTYNVVGVGFDFNGQTVLVCASSDETAAVRDWWKRMYDETPEESAARR